MSNKSRPEIFADFIISNNVTIRYTANHFGLSKSTVHIDVSKRLKDIDYDLYCKVKKVLDHNFSERHIRGGNATKMKYLSQKFMV